MQTFFICFAFMKEHKDNCSELEENNYYYKSEYSAYFLFIYETIK